jgi:hypothetical protein
VWHIRDKESARRIFEEPLTARPSNALAILEVCRQSYHETALLPFELIIFRFGSPTIDKWIQQLEQWQLEQWQQIAVRYISLAVESIYLDLSFGSMSLNRFEVRFPSQLSNLRGVEVIIFYRPSWYVMPTGTVMGHYEVEHWLQVEHWPLVEFVVRAADENPCDDGFGDDESDEEESDGRDAYEAESDEEDDEGSDGEEYDYVLWIGFRSWSKDRTCAEETHERPLVEVINYLRMEDWNGGEEEVDDEESYDEEVHKEAFDEDEVDLEVIEGDR